MTLLWRKVCPDELSAAQGHKSLLSVRDPIDDEGEQKEEEGKEEEIE